MRDIEVESDPHTRRELAPPVEGRRVKECVDILPTTFSVEFFFLVYPAWDK